MARSVATVGTTNAIVTNMGYSIVFAKSLEGGLDMWRFW